MTSQAAAAKVKSMSTSELCYRNAFGYSGTKKMQERLIHATSMEIINRKASNSPECLEALTRGSNDFDRLKRNKNNTNKS